MRLHKDAEAFRELISVLAADKHLPESAIERDYYIVLLLKNLSESEYADVLSDFYHPTIKFGYPSF